MELSADLASYRPRALKAPLSAAIMYSAAKEIPVHVRPASVSSSETIRASLERDVFSTVWNEGVFFAGGSTRSEALEKAVSESDYAIAIAQPDDIVESRGEQATNDPSMKSIPTGLFWQIRPSPALLDTPNNRRVETAFRSSATMDTQGAFRLPAISKPQ